MITLQVLQVIGFGMTKELVGVIIHDYLKDQPTQSNPFQHGVPGKDWWQLFLKRWEKAAGVRKPQHLPTSQASTASHEAIGNWFDRLEYFLSKVGLQHMPLDELQLRLWNCDETGFCSAQACKRGDDIQDTIGGSGREYYSFLATGSAGGCRLPP